MMAHITVYTTPGCAQCRATTSLLDRALIAYTTVDVSEGPDARDYLLSLGYLHAPVVYAGPDRHWSGFRPDRLRALAGHAA
jgi:glutaredoxin-like protein NrdH